MPFTPRSALISSLRILSLRLSPLIKRRTLNSAAWTLLLIFDISVHDSHIYISAMDTTHRQSYYTWSIECDPSSRKSRIALNTGVIVFKSPDSRDETSSAVLYGLQSYIFCSCWSPLPANAQCVAVIQSTVCKCIIASGLRDLIHRLTWVASCGRSTIDWVQRYVIGQINSGSARE